MKPDEFKRIRKSLGLTQAELADLLGFDNRFAVTHYETGFRISSILVAALMRIFSEMTMKEFETFSAQLQRKVDREKRYRDSE